MADAAWLRARDEPWWRSALLAPLVPAAWLYGAGAVLHRAAYRTRLPWSQLEPVVLPVPVVSVGNLVVGGTGKTPLAAWLAASMQSRGHRVVVLSRGYGARRRRRQQVLSVSDGRRLLSRAEVAGDEPLLLAAHAPGVPVVVGRDRIRAARHALAVFGPTLLVMDDGFQHHRLHRDVQLVSVDGHFGFGNRWLLPRGPLREPLRALSAADAFCVVDGPLVEDAEASIERHAPECPRFFAERRPLGLRPLRGGARSRADSLDGVEVGVFAGLANPDSLRRTLDRLGAVVVAERWLPDHHRYRRADFRRFLARAPRWITTEKDAIKITPDWVAGHRIDVLAMRLQPSDPDALLQWLDLQLARRAQSDWSPRSR